jgi:hypothetical protein
LLQILYQLQANCHYLWIIPLLDIIAYDLTNKVDTVHMERNLFHVIFKVKGTAEIDLARELDDVAIHRQDVGFELP